MASTAACQKLGNVALTMDCPARQKKRSSSHSLGLPYPPPPPQDTSFSIYPSSPSTVKTMFRQLHSDHAILANPSHLRAAHLTGSTSCMSTGNYQEPPQLVTPPMDISASTSMSSCFTSSNSDDGEDDEDACSSSTSSFSQFVSPTQATDLEEPLNNLASLAAALPIKRGLSHFFSGKSQSFSCLARVCSVTDLAKPENPYVKRRRMAAGGTRILSKHDCSTGPIRKRLTNNAFHPFKCAPLLQEEKSPLQGAHTKLKPWPSKCFSTPELLPGFQKIATWIPENGVLACPIHTKRGPQTDCGVIH